MALGRSRLALTLWLAAALGVGGGLWLLSLHPVLRVVLLLVLLASGRDLLRPRRDREILLWDGSAWWLSRGDTDRAALGDCRWEFVSRWLVVPSFRAGRRRKYRPVFVDAVTPEVFRALLVLARSKVSAPG